MGFEGRTLVPIEAFEVFTLCGITLGVSQYRAGKWEAADQTYAAVLTWLDQAPAEKQVSFYQVVALNARGMLASDLGRFGEAEQHLRQAIALLAAAPPDSVQQPLAGYLDATVHNNLAQVFSSQRRFVEARASFQEALVRIRAYQRTPIATPDPATSAAQGSADAQQTSILTDLRNDSASFGEASILSSLANLDYIEGKIAAAEAQMREAIGFARKAQQDGLAFGIYANLAAMLRSEGRNEDALAALDEADRLPQAGRIPAYDGIAEITRGELYQAANKTADAQAAYTKARTIFATAGIAVGEAYALGKLGFLAADKQKDLKQAESDLTAAVNLIEEVRASAGDDQSRLQFFTAVVGIYYKLIAVQLDQSRVEQAFEVSERGRARSFLDTLSTGTVQLASAEDQALFEQTARRYAEREQARALLAAQQAKSERLPSYERTLNYQLITATAAYSETLQQLEQRSSALRALVPGRITLPPLANIFARLGSDSALVSYWMLENELVAFVLRSGQIKVHRIAVTRAALVDTVRGARRLTQSPKDVPPELAPLYELIFAPLEDELNDLRLLYIVPHDVLHYVPFAALPSPSGMLIERFPIALLPSATSLALLPDDRPQSDALVLSYADPPVGSNLAELAFATQEADDVAKLYATQPFNGAVATVDAVRTHSGAASVLHLAAHGTFDLQDPLRSTLWLSPQGANAGRLDVRSVYGLRLQNTDLVVLSACQTLVNNQIPRLPGTVAEPRELQPDETLSAVQLGDELVGLTRAFFTAGAPSVVATLWSVNDEASAKLMVAFHRHLRSGLGKAEALRQAQLELRKDSPNPYFWAGFTLSGRPGPLVAPPAAANEPAAIGAAQIPGLPQLWPWLGGGLGLLALLALLGRRLRPGSPRNDDESGTRRAGRPRTGRSRSERGERLDPRDRPSSDRRRHRDRREGRERRRRSL